MKSIATILNNYGRLGVELLKLDVSKISATGKTEESIHFTTDDNEDFNRLTYWGRKYFSAIETGRGPRESNKYGGYDKSLLEYMEARGMLTGLSARQKKRKAKSLAFFINKHGDSTYRSGGRVVYSDSLQKIAKELTEALKKDVKKFTIQEIKNAFSTKQETA